MGIKNWKKAKLHTKWFRIQPVYHKHTRILTRIGIKWKQLAYINYLMDIPNSLLYTVFKGYIYMYHTARQTRRVEKKTNYLHQPVVHYGNIHCQLHYIAMHCKGLQIAWKYSHHSTHQPSILHLFVTISPYLIMLSMPNNSTVSSV